MSNLSIAITISRQLGSGGAFIGHRIAKKMGFSYLNHEIITQVASELNVLEETLNSKDEKITSFWEKTIESMTFSFPDYFTPPLKHMPTDVELFNVESNVIKKAAQNNNVVVIGRCGSIVLKDHPRLVSVFLHAPLIFRLHRVRKLYKVSSAEALRRIKINDSERAHYFKAFSGMHWVDARNYTLSINTSITGLENAEKLILNYVNAKFGDAAL